MFDPEWNPILPKDRAIFSNQVRANVTSGATQSYEPLGGSGCSFNVQTCHCTQMGTYIHNYKTYSFLNLFEEKKKYIHIYT